MPSNNSLDHSRAQALARQRRLSRDRTLKRRSAREAAILTGKAVALTPDEYATLHGVSVWTVYRRCNDGTLKHRKFAKGKRGGRILIDADQIQRGTAR